MKFVLRSPFFLFCACDEIDDIVGVACKCASDVVCFVVH